MLCRPPGLQYLAIYKFGSQCEHHFLVALCHMHLSDLLLQGVIIENLGDLRFEEVMSALLYGIAPTVNQAVSVSG